MFALAAAIVALLALLGVGEDMMWWWLMFIAFHFAFGWGLPIPGPPWAVRRTDGG